MVNNCDRADFKTELEAAEYLAVSLSCMRKWRSRQFGPKYCRFGKLIRYRRSDLDKWAEERRTGTSNNNIVND
jgi:excisionase family DNA binding protein